MKNNGKEVNVICTLENDTLKITIPDDNNNNLKFPSTDIYKVAKFLVSEYEGTKKEAILVLNDCISEVVAKHLPESIKNIIVYNAVLKSIPDEIKDFVDVGRIVRHAISDEQKELLVKAKLRQSKLLILPPNN